MTPLDNRLAGQVAQGLAADGRSLDALRREAQRDPHRAVKKAAQQFEAVFMQMVLKSMRDALPQSGMFDSTAQQMYTGMLDAQLATKVAASGTGLADMIAAQLTRHIPVHDASPPRTGGGPSQVPPSTDRRADAARPNPNGAARYAELAASDASAGARPASRSVPAADAPSTAAADPVRRSFVLRHWDHALAAQRQTGIPAGFIVGQAALESGWGRHEIRDAAGRPSHNLFGIKAGANWRGRTVEVLTSEYENGVERKVVERFRAYDSYGEAFRDWAQLMSSNPRYVQVLRAGRDARGFADGLQRAGYATDPQYGAKLARAIDAAVAVRGRA
ncbi:MAG: flagellar assembly peptidoglycan hydrolase FlgJ [Burkholderiaceae bacterium]